MTQSDPVGAAEQLDQTIAAYDDAAHELAARYDALLPCAAFRQLVPFFQASGLALDIGAVFEQDRAEAAATIAAMPANFTRFPNSDQRVFEVVRQRRAKATGMEVDLGRLQAWGKLLIPGHLWRTLSRFGAWIDPMLIAEWSRLMRTYGDRMRLPVALGMAEAALDWREPVRSTSIARLAAERIFQTERQVECIWTGQKLPLARLDIDHCLPWAAWPCGDLWNLGPCDRKVNQYQKRDRLPSAPIFADSEDRIIGSWERAYLADPALGARFTQEVMAAVPITAADDPSEIYSALDWRRLRLLQDQRVPEWTLPTVVS